AARFALFTVARDGMEVVGPFEFRHALDRVAEDAIRFHRAVLMNAIVEEGDSTGEGRYGKHATIAGRDLLPRRGPRIHRVGAAGRRDETVFEDEITDTDFRAGDGDADLGIGRDGSVGVVEPDQNGKRVTDIDVMRRRKRYELWPAFGDDRDEVVER